jgi:hypothetical protein
MTESGPGKGRLVDVGPIILGHRLSTRKTRGAYQTLIYEKGALVLRMLHFLLSDPVTGEDKPFFDMMTDFVSRYREKAASTDDFRRVAGEHFAKSPIGRMYRQNNLDWFFAQWVRTRAHALLSNGISLRRPTRWEGSVYGNGHAAARSVRLVHGAARDVFIWREPAGTGCRPRLRTKCRVSNQTASPAQES